MTLEGLKVVTARAMAAAEKASIEAGASGLEYMLTAARGLAKEVSAFVASKKLKKKLMLLVGKGNNGGDSLAMATFLKLEGFEVTACLCFDPTVCSPLCFQMLSDFEKKGGKTLVVSSLKDLNLGSDGVIIDALFGTGFSGSPSQEISQIIDCVNQSQLPILSIDIPSGIDGNTGKKGGSAIHATHTYFLGLPKVGFFLQDGFEHVGEFKGVDFGLSNLFVDQMEASGYLLDVQKLKEQLPKLKRCQHKYIAGHVAIIAGSNSMEGAAFLASKACYRTGAGLVHLFSSKGVDSIFFQALPEVIKGRIDQELSRHIKELKALKACVIGPGLDASCKESKKVLEQVWQESECGLVIDASGLALLKEKIEHGQGKSVVLTPHRGEMARLLGVDKLSDEALLETMQSYSEKTGAVLVLKGAPTFVFAPKTKPLIITAGTPALATAGSGDVLSGMIGAFVSKGLELRVAAALGVYIHAVSGEKAADKLSDYSLLASDLIEQIPSVIAQMEQ